MGLSRVTQKQINNPGTKFTVGVVQQGRLHFPASLQVVARKVSQAPLLHIVTDHPARALTRVHGHLQQITLSRELKWTSGKSRLGTGEGGKKCNVTREGSRHAHTRALIYSLQVR